VAIATTFGPNILESFTIWTDEVTEDGAVIPPQNRAMNA
jgi:hypothetical protein